jgi:hypothetical protein
MPRVAGGAEGLGLGEVPLADLGRVGLADHDRAGRAQAADRLGVARGHPVLAGAAERSAVTGEVDVVLDRHRRPQQRRALAGAEAAIGLVRVGQGLLVADDAEGVERRLRGLDSAQRPLSQLP